MQSGVWVKKAPMGLRDSIDYLEDHMLHFRDAGFEYLE
jgi:hypothetical protein